MPNAGRTHEDGEDPSDAGIDTDGGYKLVAPE